MEKLTDFRFGRKRHNANLNIFIHIPKCAGGTVQRHIDWAYDERTKLQLSPYYKDERFESVLSVAEIEELRSGSTALKREWISRYIRALSPSQMLAIRCVYGHAPYYGIHELFEREPRYITFLREPVARFVSYYNYMTTIRVSSDRLEQYELQKPGGVRRSLEEWLEEADLNRYSMLGFLLKVYGAESLSQPVPSLSCDNLEVIKKMLSSFYFVGLTEVDDDLQFVYNRLGINFYKPDKNVLRLKDDYILPMDMRSTRKFITSKYPYEQELYEYAVALNAEMKSRIKDFRRAVVYTRLRRKISKMVSAGQS